MLIPDDETCYRAVQSRDPRFDGWFFTAVRTTGIYCRPSCPAITPQRRNVSFHPSAAAAQRAGYRACKRCRPDASPGSPEWNIRGDLAGRALRLIADGVIDRDGVPGLASRLGYSERQLHRTLTAEVGAGPARPGPGPARTDRAGAARDHRSAGHRRRVRGRIRQRAPVQRHRPRGVRGATERPARRAAARPSPEPGVVVLRLPYRAPMAPAAVLDFLGAHAVPGLETYADGVFTRTVDAPGGPALIALEPGDGAVTCRVRLTETRDLVTVVARVRRLLDLDADPVAVDAALERDPHLAPLVRKRPGVRAPGTVDGVETAIRTVVGQQISLRGARTVLGRIVAEHGRVAFDGEPWRLFPSAGTLAAVDPATLPMPRARGRTVHALSTAFAAGDLALDPGVDRPATRSALLALPGVGPWTADYLLMRAAADPDVLLASDLVVKRAAADLGVELRGGRPDWAPWRTYATYHLWSHLYADLWSVTP